MSTNESDHAVVIALAEFNALRSEIDGALGAQQALINVNIVSAGLVSGFVVANEADVRLLLVSTILSAALGLYVQGSWYHVRRITSYIESNLRPVLIEYSQDPRIFSWEREVRRRRDALGRILPTALSMGVMFTLVPLVMLIWVARHLQDQLSWSVWALSLLLFLVHLSVGILLSWHILRSKGE